MPELLEILDGFDILLTQAFPKIASRLQPGLSRAEIDTQIATYSWEFPQEAFDLYRWHNGLSGKPGKLNLAQKLLRLKGKWHGELSGRENEVHLQLGNRLIVAKFLPLDYALAGHRHLKLGRCSIDLLPMAILTDGQETIYCMMRLAPENPIVYCANGTKLPPIEVTESFLSTQPQFSQLSGLIAFLSAVFQPRMPSIAASEEGSIDSQLDPVEFERLYSEYKFDLK
jgi:hypothetical protein